MSETLLREIAERIAREQFLLQWPIYALMLGIAVVVGIASAYLGAYAKRRGENFATKADFNNLLAQVKATTAVAEEVKAQVSHADWATRERKTLLRLKLEDLLKAIYELKEWQGAMRDHRVFGGKEPGTSPSYKVELIAGLYFQELADPIRDYCKLDVTIMQRVLAAQQALLGAPKDVEAQRALREQFIVDWALLYQDQLKVISAVEKRCREIMAGLIEG